MLARRRPRASGEPACWLVHALIGDGDEAAPPHYETDRARFVGRGYTLAAPKALVETTPLSGTVGNVLDPIVSLRRTVQLAAGGEAQVTFLLGAASEREAALALAARFATPAAVIHELPPPVEGGWREAPGGFSRQTLQLPRRFAPPS